MLGRTGTLPRGWRAIRKFNLCIAKNIRCVSDLEPYRSLKVELEVI